MQFCHAVPFYTQLIVLLLCLLHTNCCTSSQPSVCRWLLDIQGEGVGSDQFGVVSLLDCLRVLKTASSQLTRSQTAPCHNSTHHCQSSTFCKREPIHYRYHDYSYRELSKTHSIYARQHLGNHHLCMI